MNIYFTVLYNDAFMKHCRMVTTLPECIMQSAPSCSEKLKQMVSDSIYQMNKTICSNTGLYLSHPSLLYSMYPRVFYNLIILFSIFSHLQITSS